MSDIRRMEYDIALLVMADKVCHFSKAIARMIIEGYREQMKYGKLHHRKRHRMRKRINPQPGWPGPPIPTGG